MNVALQASQIANRGSLEFTIRRPRFGKAIGVLSEGVSNNRTESVVYTISACFLTFEVEHKSSPTLVRDPHDAFSMIGRRGMVPIADSCLFEGGYWRRPGRSPLDVLVLVAIGSSSSSS